MKWISLKEEIPDFTKDLLLLAQKPHPEGGRPINIYFTGSLGAYRKCYLQTTFEWNIDQKEFKDEKPIAFMYLPETNDFIDKP